MFNTEQCVSLNYLVEELIYANVPFCFIPPTGHEDSIKLSWRSDEDQVTVVSRIVNDAIARDAQVLIGWVDMHENKTAYFVGFNDSFVDPNPDNVA